MPLNRCVANSKSRTTVYRRSLKFESLEDRLVLSTVLPFSQLEISSYNENVGGLAVDAFNGDGLTGELHNNQLTDSWHSGGAVASGRWIKVDLGGTYNLDYLKVWNFNWTGLTHRGVKQADIYVALNDPGNNTHDSGVNFDPTGWTLAIENQQFVKASGAATISPTDPEMSLGGVQAAYLAIFIDSAWSGGNVGLSEIQIYADDSGLPTYPLTVNGGSGDGLYIEGNQVDVVADPAPAGQIFDAWIGDVSYLADILDPTTILTMPANAATITATYQTPSPGSGSWQIDFAATGPYPAGHAPMASNWDAGFGTTWNSYDQPFRGNAPPQTGFTSADLTNSLGGASSVDFSLVSGTTLGMIANFQGAGIENTIYSVAREHLFWGGDSGTGAEVGFEFSDLSPGTYDLTFITNPQWHIPHRGFDIAIDEQMVDFRPEAGGSENAFGILSYKKDFLDITVSNITVGATGILAGTMTEPQAISDPSLAGMILTQVTIVPQPENADFDEDGDVDGADFLSWQRGFGTNAGSGNVAPLASGNANGDQFVNGNDQAIWQQQFGQISGATSAEKMPLEPLNTASLKTASLSTTATITQDLALAAWAYDTLPRSRGVQQFGIPALADRDTPWLDDAGEDGRISSVEAISAVSHENTSTPSSAEQAFRQARLREAKEDYQTNGLDSGLDSMDWTRSIKYSRILPYLPRNEESPPRLQPWRELATSAIS